MTKSENRHSISVLRKELKAKKTKSLLVIGEREKLRLEFQTKDRTYHEDLQQIEADIEEIQGCIEILSLQTLRQQEPRRSTTKRVPRNFQKGDKVVITSPTGKLKGTVATVKKETNCQVELEVPGKSVTVYRSKSSVEHCHEK